MLPHSIATRLASQLDGLAQILRDASPDLLIQRSPDGKWSAHENLAHLLRHHQIMIERIQCILHEDRPALPRYRAEEDRTWPQVASLPLPEVLSLLQSTRERLAALVRELPETQLQRTGVHPVFGEMTIPNWLEFFLLHEAHHLYVVLTRIGGARTRRS